MIFFNKNIIPEIHSSLLNFDIEILKYGMIRFNDNILTDIYFYANIKNTKKWKSECILKYNYVDNNLIYSNIYLSPLNRIEKNLIYEYRYDIEMNLQSIYHFMNAPKSDFTDLDLMCVKIYEKGEAVSIPYRFPTPRVEGKFENYIKWCVDKKIINDTNSYSCSYFTKEKNTYLRVGK